MRAPVALLMVASLCLPTAAAAQMWGAQPGQTAAAPVRAQAGGAVFVAQPVGEFDEYVDVGFGLGGHVLLRLDPAGVIGLRVDGGFINYGRESKRVCLSQTVGCRILVDLVTSNDILFGTIGPQLAVPSGPVRPYVNGGIGLSYFATTSSVRGTSSSDDDFARTKNFDDVTLAWAAGGGLYIPLRIGSTTFAIDLGARYLLNGEVEYLREGGIEDHPDGSITLHPTRSDANLLVWNIGVSFGIPGGR
ncbi:MAG: hypothetical protein DIU52_010900 [bacterium]|jgi:opacity protein-like surface antigen|nr:MAG: hypothetical protein DIU52_02480 [bacterium]